MTPTNDLAPTSPHLAPTAGGDLRNRPRLLAPSPLGARSNWSPNDDHPKTHSSSPQGRGHQHTSTTTTRSTT